MKTKYKKQIIIDIDTGEILINKEYITKTINIIKKEIINNGIKYIDTTREVRIIGKQLNLFEQ